MQENSDEVQLSKLESIFVLGVIGCLLLATWELGHLIADVWFVEWVSADKYIRKRIIYYGIAFIVAITAVLVTTRCVTATGHFGKTINRAVLWYGTLLLLSAIGICAFDLLPRVIAGLIGATVFIVGIYMLQKKYFTKERVMKNRLEKGKCFSCGTGIKNDSIYCSGCGTQVGSNCPACDVVIRKMDKFCFSCGGQGAG